MACGAWIAIGSEIILLWLGPPRSAMRWGSMVKFSDFFFKKNVTKFQNLVTKHLETKFFLQVDFFLSNLLKFFSS